MIQVQGLAGRVAVVTGGGRGIGKATAAALVANGARVAVIDIVPPTTPDVLNLTCDVSDPAQVEAAIARVETELGPISVAVMAAGIFPTAPIEETTLESWQRCLDVNLTGSFLVAKRVLPAMREAGYGRLIFLGSSAGKAGGARAMSSYAASKAGVMTLAKAIANEYAKTGVTANALAPTMIDTPMIDGQRELVSRIPVGRLGKPEEVAALICFLASEHAGYITGEITDINGGFFVD